MATFDRSVDEHADGWERQLGSTLVVGLGSTGLACVRHLRRRGLALSVVDSREDPPGLAELRQDFSEVPVTLGKFPTRLFESADRVVLSPGVSLTDPAVRAARDRGVPVVGDIELFAQALMQTNENARVVAITGSNGKSTVTTMVAQMAAAHGLAVAGGGNLGPPALDLLHRGAELFIMELSSFQLETTYSLRPDVATVLNLSPDHMDRYADLQAYAAAKARVFHGARAAVVNADDVWVERMVRESGIGEPRRFSIQRQLEQGYSLITRDGLTSIARDGSGVVALHELSLPGLHNAANALAATAIADALGLEDHAIIEVLKSYQGLPHRCELVACRDECRWYNDSKATNVGATVAALAGLGAHGPVILIAGGEGKNQNFAALTPALTAHAKGLVIIGRDGPDIASVAPKGLPVVFGADMSEAVGLAQQQTRPGDAVLLSPACASFDMYENYEARGDAFRRAVQELLAL